MVDINDYTQEKECEYNGETFKARDNGAICRMPKNEGRRRRLDNKWTFGVKHSDNGYMFLSDIRVHQVVARAFHGDPTEENLVVDHIDTNRCNNRPENLCWVTRLENALNNPITRKKILFYCGSIEAFLADPSILPKGVLWKNDWMRTVTKEEAAICLRNLTRWSEELNTPRVSSTKSHRFDYSIFKEKKTYAKLDDNSDLSLDAFLVKENYQANRDHYTDEESYLEELQDDFTESLTSSALQENWRTPTEFPKCPAEVTDLVSYQKNLNVGDVFCTNKYGTSTILDTALSEDCQKLLVCLYNPDTIKKWSLVLVYIKKRHYIHSSVSTYFSENGMKKDFTIEQGKEWRGEDSIDDYCS